LSSLQSSQLPAEKYATALLPAAWIAVTVEAGVSKRSTIQTWKRESGKVGCERGGGEERT
jgi:hypothetical protein